MDHNLVKCFQIGLPAHLQQVFSQLNSEEINAFVEDKKKLEFNRITMDNISVSSYDGESESFDNNSNDESTWDTWFKK